MLTPIAYLQALDLIHKKGSACLDIGADQGRHSKRLVELGYVVDAIDILPMQTVPEGVTFKQIDLDEFKPDKEYDLVLARNVLPFIEHPLRQLGRLTEFLCSGGVLLVTLFGNDDPGAKTGARHGVNLEDAYAVLRRKDNLEMLHYGTYHQYCRGRNDGPRSLWHIHDFIVRKY